MAQIKLTARQRFQAGFIELVLTSTFQKTSAESIFPGPKMFLWSGPPGITAVGILLNVISVENQSGGRL